MLKTSKIAVNQSKTKMATVAISDEKETEHTQNAVIWKRSYTENDINKVFTTQTV